MKVTIQNYDQMRAWMAVLAPELFPHSSPETNPINVLDRIYAESPANARKGLAMAIGDSVDFSNDWPPERVMALDRRLNDMGLPTLSEIRAGSSKDVQRVLRRGHIRTEIEYYAIRNAVEYAEADEARMWELLDAYETRVAPE